MPEMIFHLIGNAHLDPVWLWDWQEGLNEGLITCRTILDMMDQDKDLTFIRGEAAIYQHIEKTDPKTFARIKKRVDEGRWDVVGGTMIQPDTNLPATESFARQYLHGQEYFRKTFGQPVRAAWAADSFGHAAGLPDIMAQAGITCFAFTRPDSSVLPLAKPAFWWEGPSGARILSYRPLVGWYGTERVEILARFDGLLAAAKKGDLQNVGAFYGLGNHGGGPTRRQLAEIRQWAQQHPEVRVVHSGLHRLFDALTKEIKGQDKNFLPVHRGEMNFCLRGCYASVAKLKFAYRKTENMAQRAEKTDAVISASLRKPAAETRDIWDAILFGGFHDILPGSSIERGYDDQIGWLGGAQHRSQEIELQALNALAAQVDTRVRKPQGDYPSGVVALVWNPHPVPFDGPVELEASLDYRPIWQYSKGNVDQLPLELLGVDGKPSRFQTIATEHSAMPQLAWRKRVVTPMKLPAFGWSVLEFGWVEGARPAPQPAQPVISPAPGVIDNGFYRVEAQSGQKGIRVFHKGKAVFNGEGLSAVVFDDPWGSWGGMAEEPEAIKLVTTRETWTIDQVQLMESGPQRAALWVRFAGKNSWLALTVSVSAERETVDIAARVLWNDRSARLKLVMPGVDQAEFDVPGASVTRKPCGEVPGGRWVRATGPDGTFGFASDSLYGFDCTAGELRATIVRASRYANDVKTAADEQLWRPAVDCGELRFRFLISPGDEHLPMLAQQLEQPPMVVLIPPHDGKLARQGSLASLAPESLQLLALKPATNGKGFILRVRETAGKATRPAFTWMGRKLALGSIKPNAIATWRLKRTVSGWKATPTTILED